MDCCAVLLHQIAQTGLKGGDIPTMKAQAEQLVRTQTVLTYTQLRETWRRIHAGNWSGTMQAFIL